MAQPSAARAERWVAALIEHPHASIIEASSLLGLVRLDRVDLVDRRASLAIGLLRLGDQGRDIGTEAARRVLAYGFAELGLHPVSLRVLADNCRAIRSYEKCGFRVEGRSVKRCSSMAPGATDHGAAEPRVPARGRDDSMDPAFRTRVAPTTSRCRQPLQSGSVKNTLSLSATSLDIDVLNVCNRRKSASGRNS